MARQAIKKGAGIKATKFSVENLKNDLLGEKVAKTADKELEWIIMPKGFQDALKLPGIPMGRGVTTVRGWSDTGKSTIKNCAIAAAMRQGILPVIFETEGNFDFQYAKDCGMDIEPVYEDVEYVDEETGEVIKKKEITNWKGDYILFTNSKICEFCGDMDYSTGTKKAKKRKVAVIEDIAYIINTFLDKQDNGEIPMPLLFVWDSVGSIQSYKSYASKVGNNQFDANAIAVSFKPIFGRISASKEVGSPYTNTLLVVNKIWQDSMNSMGGAVSVENNGGKAIFYATRLGLHCGGTAKPATKKLKATLKGQEYQYGTLAKLSVFKTQLPVPFNIVYNGTICCVHNGIISEDELDEYKKKELPHIFEKIKQMADGKLNDVSADDIEFTEEGSMEG